MRPKRVILIVGPDEKQQSVLACTLYVNGYRVLRASSEPEAVAIFATAPITDLVIIDGAQLPMFPAWRIAERIKQMRNYTPVIVLAEWDLETQGGCVADAAIPGKYFTGLAMYERVKMMTKRKRGPRKADGLQISTICTKDVENHRQPFVDIGNGLPLP